MPGLDAGGPCAYRIRHHVGPFRYVVLYNDTSTGDKLICYWDYGSAVTLNSGDTFTIDFDGSAGVLTIA